MALGMSRRLFSGTLRRKVLCCVVLTLAFFFMGIWSIFSDSARAAHEQYLKQHIADLQMRLQWLDSFVRRQEARNPNEARVGRPDFATSLPPRVHKMLHNMTGMHAARGFNVSNLTPLRLPYLYQLMPHLLLDESSVRPGYHLRGTRAFVDVVMGIPTVRRDMESYLAITLTHLIEGITTAADEASALIVVFVGESDPEYVLSVARAIETLFPRQVESGLIEVIAPSASYYPDLNSLPESLGDPVKRVRWRTKQNLDQIFLMSYAQTKGTYYLMLEDDVVAKNDYLKEIRRFTSATSASLPRWIIIEFCRLGGIAKLFKSAHLVHFITYVQLFYDSMPLDWLMEAYLADRVCSIEQIKKCVREKDQVRPRYRGSLFQHIGLYSSLRGKIQKLKDNKFGKLPLYHPHINPAVSHIRNDIAPYQGHTLDNAYRGKGFFWGSSSKLGDIMEFTFAQPIKLRRFLIRTGNMEHISDRLTDTTVEVLPVGVNSTDVAEYTIVGTFDESGVAEGFVDEAMGDVKAVRLAVHKASAFWTLISEVDTNFPTSHTTLKTLFDDKYFD